MSNIAPLPNTYNPRVLDLEWGRFHGDRFAAAEKVANIRVDLNLRGLPQTAHEEIIGKMVRKYRSAISRYFYGNRARQGKAQANLVVHHHAYPQHHVHMLLEVPEHRLFREVRDFTNDFIFKNRDRFVPRDGQFCFFEEADDLTGSAIYNAKYGPETLILF